MVKFRRLRRLLAGLMCVGLVTSGLTVYADVDSYDVHQDVQEAAYEESSEQYDTQLEYEYGDDWLLEDNQNADLSEESIVTEEELFEWNLQLPEDLRLISDMKEHGDDRILDTSTTTITLRKGDKPIIFGNFRVGAHKYWLDDGTQVYCIQSLKRGPDSSSYQIETVYDNTHPLTKMMYYGYGGPGYDWNSPIFQLIHGVGSNVDAYYFTHFISSYIMDGAQEPYYMSPTLQMIGFTPSGSSKTFAELCYLGYKELLNMPAAPEGARCAVFQGLKQGTAVSNTQKMGFFMWQWQPPKEGYVKLVKSSTNPDVSSGNANYSLAGAIYTVYRDSSLSNIVGTLTTDASGNTNTLTLEGGTYYVKETSAPKGFNLDPQVYTATIQPEQTFVVYSSDSPKMGSVEVIKSSANTSITNNNSNYSLKGAIYGVYSDNNCYNEVGRITTDVNGWGRLDNLSGGRYYIKEIKASPGYNLDTNVYPVDCNV